MRRVCLVDIWGCDIFLSFPYHFGTFLNRALKSRTRPQPRSFRVIPPPELDTTDVSHSTVQDPSQYVFYGPLRRCLGRLIAIVNTQRRRE